MENTLFEIRVTGILIEQDKILLLRQFVNDGRSWSLPGGKLEHGETLEQAMIREMHEETGLDVGIQKLLYVCDKPDASPPLIHITFLLKRLSGELRIPSENLEIHEITAVEFVPIERLEDLGFSQRFVQLIRSGFHDCGSYQGLKSNIGL